MRAAKGGDVQAWRCVEEAEWLRLRDEADVTDGQCGLGCFVSSSVACSLCHLVSFRLFISVGSRSHTPTVCEACDEGSVFMYKLWFMILHHNHAVMSCVQSGLCCGFSLCFTEWGSAHSFLHFAQTHCGAGWWLLLYHCFISMCGSQIVFDSAESFKINALDPHCAFWIEIRESCHWWLTDTVSSTTNKPHVPDWCWVLEVNISW